MERTAPALRPVAALLEEFARAARQSGQYPLHHAVSLAATERARQALLKLFPEASGEVVQLSSSPSGLLFDGEALPEMGPGQVWLNEGLRRRLVKTLIIQPELETSDVLALIELLTLEPEEILSQGSVPEWLRQKGVPRLRVEEQDYRRLLRESETTLLDLVAGEKDAASQAIIRHCLHPLEKDLSQAPERDGTALPLSALSLPNLVALLQYVSTSPAAKNETALPEELSLTPDLTALAEMELSPADFLAFGLANTIQAGFQALRASGEDFLSWKTALQQQILALEPETRARLFRAPLVNPGEADALEEVAQDWSPEILLEQIVFTLPEALIGETSSALERLFRRLMPSPERQLKLEPLLREKFLAAGNSPEIYRNVVGLLLDNLAKEQMLEENRPGYHLSGVVLEQTPIYSRVAIGDLLATITPEALARARSALALDLRLEKLSLAEYDTLCNELAAWAQYWLEHPDPALAGELLSALGDEITSRQDGSYRMIAATSLGRINTPENAAWLARQIMAAPEETQNQLLIVLSRLGKSGAEALLNLVFASPSEKLSRQAALAACNNQSPLTDKTPSETAPLTLVTDGRQSQESFSIAQMLTRRLATEPAEKVVRVVKLLLSGNCPNAVKVGAGALRHSRPWVGVVFLQTLADNPSPAAAGLLLSTLDSPRPEIRLEAARALNKISGTLPSEIAERALGPLVRLAQNGGFSAKSRPLRLLAIGALGKLQQDTAIPALTNLLQDRGWFFAKGRRQIRFAAAAALAEIASPAALEILRQGRREGVPGITQACQAALDRFSLSQTGFRQKVEGKG